MNAEQFLEQQNPHLCVWQEVLQVHDTNGLPFDLIYKKLKEATDWIPDCLSNEQFERFLVLQRER